MPTTAEPDPPQRVVVFIDEANVYEDARRAFASAYPPISGRIKPMRYSQLLVSRQPLGETKPRELKEVRVYTGILSNAKDRVSYAAHRRQTAGWANRGATVIARPLRYPGDWPHSRPQQKGVDVHLAIDLVTMSLRQELDVVILASGDTDLRPALEACMALPGGGPTLEVAAWKAPGHGGQLRVPGHHVWCHYLEEEDYREVADGASYA